VIQILPSWFIEEQRKLKEYIISLANRHGISTEFVFDSKSLNECIDAILMRVVRLEERILILRKERTGRPAGKKDSAKRKPGSGLYIHKSNGTIKLENVKAKKKVVKKIEPKKAEPTKLEPFRQLTKAEKNKYMNHLSKMKYDEDDDIHPVLDGED
jgi:hypothetical protein